MKVMDRIKGWYNNLAWEYKAIGAAAVLLAVSINSELRGYNWGVKDTKEKYRIEAPAGSVEDILEGIDKQMNHLEDAIEKESKELDLEMQKYRRQMDSLERELDIELDNLDTLDDFEKWLKEGIEPQEQKKPAPAPRRQYKGGGYQPCKAC